MLDLWYEGNRNQYFEFLRKLERAGTKKIQPEPELT